MWGCYVRLHLRTQDEKQGLIRRPGQSCALSQPNSGSYLTITHKGSSFTLLAGCFHQGTNTSWVTRDTVADRLRRGQGKEIVSSTKKNRAGLILTMALMHLMGCNKGAPIQKGSEVNMITDRDLLINTYNKFNARDIDAVLAQMHPDVDWPNGWEGGRVYGREGIRDYWTRQWKALDPHVEPVGFDTDETGRSVVKVHQVVRDLSGNVISEGMVEHVYLIEDGLIKSMDIREP